MPSLAEIQDAFTNALLDRTVPVPAAIRGATRRRSDRRFAVYRNNVASGLVAALATRFPVVKRLVGDDFFRATAHAYATVELPRSPLMLYYGETFPAFIEDFAPAAPIAYLADIARIEMARGLAFHAADATPVDIHDFAALPMDRVAELRIRLHPSISIIQSRHPIYSIWHLNQDPDRFVPILPFVSEAVLVARPYLRVKTQRITHDTAMFICSLAAGRTVGDSIRAATAAESLAVLISAKIVVGVA